MEIGTLSVNDLHVIGYALLNAGGPTCIALAERLDVMLFSAIEFTEVRLVTKEEAQ